MAVKTKLKRLLKNKLKELKPNIAKEGDTNHLSEPLVHQKQSHFRGKSTRCYELMFEMWHKCSHEYDEWDTYVEGLHIDIIDVK